jgi:hypothetical protein
MLHKYGLYQGQLRDFLFCGAHNAKGANFREPVENFVWFVFFVVEKSDFAKTMAAQANPPPKIRSPRLQLFHDLPTLQI